MKTKNAFLKNPHEQCHGQTRPTTSPNDETVTGWTGGDAVDTSRVSYGDTPKGEVWLVLPGADGTADLFLGT